MTVQLAEYHFTDDVFAERLKNLIEDKNIQIDGIYDPFIYIDGGDVYVTAPLEIFGGKPEIKSKLYAAFEYSLKEYAPEIKAFAENLCKTDKIDFRVYAEDV